MSAASTSRTTKRLLRMVEAGSPGEAAVSAMSDARAGARRRMRYGLLLLALTASFTVEGIASEGAAANALVTTLLGVTLLLAFWAGGMPRRRLRRAAIPVAAAVAGVDVALIAGQGQAV